MKQINKEKQEETKEKSDKNLTLEEIKVEIERMEDDIIQERKQRNNRTGSLFSYQLYELKIEKNRGEWGGEESRKELKEKLKEQLEDICNQQQMNMEDTLDMGICLRAIKVICRTKELQQLLEQ